MAEVFWSRRIAEVARSLQAETGAANTMELAAKLAVEVIEGAEDAAISLAHRGSIVETPAASSTRALAAEKLQIAVGSGPLLADVWSEEVVAGPDLSIEERWAGWSRRVVEELGIHSVLCFRMLADKEPLGALTLYASQPHAFKTVDVDEGVSFAAHTALAVEVERNADHLRAALDSRTVIGQATGIVMQRYGIDAVRAFAVLKRLSQDRNIKLREVAAELIRTGTLG